MKISETFNGQEIVFISKNELYQFRVLYIGTKFVRVKPAYNKPLDISADFLEFYLILPDAKEKFPELFI